MFIDMDSHSFLTKPFIYSDPYRPASTVHPEK